MKDQDIKIALDRLAVDNDHIRSVIETGARLNPTVVKDDLLDFCIILGVDDLENFKDPRVISSSFGELLLIQKQDGLRLMNRVYKDNIRYILVLANTKKIDVTIVEYGVAQEYIDRDSLTKILMDKDGELVGNAKQTDIKYRQNKPTQEEFIACCNDFFIEALNVGKGLYRGQIIYSINLYQDIRTNLDRMTGYYIGCIYDFRVNVGSHYENVKTYLDREHYEKYLLTYPVPERDKLWATLFNACMLFRKEGLVVAEKLGYEYPKKADRDIIQSLRDIWNQYTSL